MKFEAWRHAMSGWARSRGCNVALFDRVGSTNDIGAALLADGYRSTAPTWVFALRQERGRGRHGRSWSSPRGRGVYATCFGTLPGDLLTNVPQLVGVALCEVLGELGVTCRLKWPNDLLVQGNKLGGVLVQARGSAEEAVVVAGFGLNVSHRAADLPRRDATSLRRELAAAVPRLDVISCALAERVDDEFEECQADPRAARRRIAERYRSWSVHRPGDRLAVRLGEDLCRGSFIGFSQNGELRLREKTGERLLSAGEVEV